VVITASGNTADDFLYCELARILLRHSSLEHRSTIRLVYLRETRCYQQRLGNRRTHSPWLGFAEKSLTAIKRRRHEACSYLAPSQWRNKPFLFWRVTPKYRLRLSEMRDGCTAVGYSTRQVIKVAFIIRTFKREKKVSHVRGSGDSQVCCLWGYNNIYKK
jgi:hypothetical protein